LLVHALKALGREGVAPSIVDTLKQRINPSHCARIIKDTQTVTGWVLQTIKQVCEECG